MSLLEVESLRWPVENPILDGLSFVLEPGAQVAISGPSGSGKSSLLRCIVALEPFEGAIQLDGTEVGPDNILQVRRAVTLVPQSPVAIADTVAANLEFARRHGSITEQEQIELLEVCGLSDLPFDRRFDRLSVGERQRLCFVRSMSLQPQVLLLDEPTASLDPASTSAIEELVAAWHTNDPQRAVVWVTHDEAQAERVATQVFHLRNGRLEAA